VFIDCGMGLRRSTQGTVMSLAPIETNCAAAASAPHLPSRNGRAWVLASAVLLATLTACGGGGGDSTTPAPPGGSTTTYTVGVSVNAVGAGENFQFALGTQAITVTQAGVSVPFTTGLATGAAYTVNQTSGPRACTLSANRTGTVASTNIAVTADCGAVAGTSALIGSLRGPIGAQLVLQKNGGDDLPVTVALSPGNTDKYDETAFSFATLLADATPYTVTVKTPPTGQTCSVYKGASGTMPVTATALRVGCEITYDLVSRSSNDAAKGTYFDSRDPVIGGSAEPIGATTQGYGEGRFIAFVSSAVGIGGSTGAHRQIFWRDQLTGETKLVSATAAGAEGNGDSWAPAISADGLAVAFESYASNLVAGDTNGVRDVFGWSALDPTGIERLSVGTGGVQANAASYGPTVSGDGRVVAFLSGASNLTPGVTGINAIHVIRRDVVAGTNKLISVNASGAPQEAGNPVLSEDGNRLAFSTFWPLLASDTNNLWDIYLYEHSASSLQRVSLTSTGGERNQGTESASRSVAPAISGNGRYVAYATTASNVVPGDTNGTQDVFVTDVQTGTVTRASVSSAGVQGNADSPVGQGERLALSHDGTWVAFSTASNTLGAGAGTTGISNVVMHNRVTGETRAVSNQTTGSVGPAAMSRSGAYVAFGAANQLDGRFASSGLFSRFTGVTRAWWWVD
jgi:Tol biopolymer transport system component